MTLFDQDRHGLRSLRSERFEYVAREVRGRCLDIGCGPHDRFVREFLGGCGIGIDVHPYEGLRPEQVVQVPPFPFPDASFGTVTFIACLNHVPRGMRAAELAEARRVLEPRGRVVVTMGLPFAEVLAHRAVRWHDRLLGTRHDVDHERGVCEDEDEFLRPADVEGLLRGAGLRPVARRRFGTQWGLNALWVAERD